MQIYIPSLTTSFISSNGQGQLCLLTCADGKDLLNHTRIRTILSRTLEKKAKNHKTLTWKIAWKSFSTAHLPFLSSNARILKAFLKTFPTKMKPTKCPAREKNMRQKKRKRRRGGKANSKSQDCCVTFKHQNSKFCFLHMPELCKLIFYIWIRRPWTVWPVNGFMVSFSSL